MYVKSRYSPVSKTHTIWEPNRFGLINYLHLITQR